MLGRASRQSSKIGGLGGLRAFRHGSHLPDLFLAKRAPELHDVKVRCLNFPGLAAVAVVDPHREHFIYNSWHFSAGDRILHDLKLSNYIPFLYHQCPALYERYHEPDVFMTKVAPIDRNGYFNFSISNSAHYAIARKAKKVIVEVNTQAQVCLGGCNEGIHYFRCGLYS